MAQKIDEDYIKVLKVLLALSFLAIFLVVSLLLFIFLGLFGSMTLFFISLGILGGILIGLYFFLILYWAEKQIENFSFQLEEEGIRIDSGVFRISQKFIPYNKIQNLELTRGIIERRYGFSTIKIETAGYAIRHAGPEGMIPGLRDPKPIMDEIHARMGKSG